MGELERVPRWGIFAGVFTTYFVMSQYVIWMNDPVRHGAGFWPGNGVTLAALLLLPKHRWRWVLSAVVAAELVGDTLVHGYPVIPSLWWATANVIEPLVAAVVLGRRPEPAAVVPAARAAEFLLVAVVLAPMLGGLIGSTGTVSEYGGSWLSTWLKFWVGDGIGVLVVAPLLLAKTPPRERTRHPAEAAALALTVAAVSAAALLQLTGDLEVMVPYASIPLIVWAAVRFGARPAFAAGFVLANAVSAANALGRGAFALDVGDGHAITLLQLFIGVALTTGMLVAALVHDNAEGAEVHRLLEQQARRDPLTGLPNRLAFTEVLTSATSGDRTDGPSTGVVFLDLDGFKEINDRLGHSAGDQVLVEVAARLAGTCRPQDVVARFGGDEFVVACAGVANAEEIQAIAKRLSDVVAQPIDVEGQLVTVGVSAGAVLSASDTTGETLLRDSDAAMYRAKRSGRRRLHLTDQSMQEPPDDLEVRDLLSVEVGRQPGVSGVAAPGTMNEPAAR